MKENEYGEVQPFIVEKECIDCGSCHRVCPNVDEKYKSLLNPKAEVCYAAARKDLQKQPYLMPRYLYPVLLIILWLQSIQLLQTDKRL